MEFDYIKQYYSVPAEMYREVVVNGKKGVITKDLGNYIGVVFYGEDQPKHPLPCHPTSEFTYLDTFNYKPPKDKNWRSKRRYLDFLDSDSGYTFREWLGIKQKPSWR